jgi:hypothetical protein
MEVMGRGKPARAPFAIAAVCACALTMLLGAPVASAATCPNEPLRAAQGTTGLPACMALEMVSPPRKRSLPAFNPWFSLDGERVVFRAVAALGDTPALQYAAGDNYVSGRSGAGWQTFPTSPPASAKIIVGSAARGGPFAFAPDLGRWLSLGATQSQSQSGVGQIYEGALDGSFEPFSPLLVARDNGGTDAVQLTMVNTELHGVATDLSRVDLQLPWLTTFLLSPDPRGMAVNNSYVASNWNGVPSLELLARDKDGVVHGGRCGARLGGGVDVGKVLSQGAVSADGLRIHFTTRPAQPFDPAKPEDPVASPPCDTANPLRVMERIGPPGQAEIAPIAPESPAGDDLFQGASTDGTKVYFATAREILPADNDTGAKCSKDPGSSSGCDLYLYDATKPVGSRLTLVSSGSGADVLPSITALSGDGTHVYFVAEGVLTADENPGGATATDGQPNLYLYESESATTSFIGTLATSDLGAMWGSEGSFIGDAYAAPFHGPGDGHILAFASDAPLTAGDDDGGHSDLFRYDAEQDTLVRVSTAPDGGEDDGPYDVVVNANSANARGANLEEKGRFASEDGETIAFQTAAALLPGDTDASDDPYVSKAGALGFVDATLEADSPPTVSSGGQEAAFASPTLLLPQDRDFIKDIYVARVDGGFPFPVTVEKCDPLIENACQGQVPPPPSAVSTPSAALAGAGNVKAGKKCKKGFVKKKGRCVKKKQGKSKKQQAKGKGKGKR